MTEIGNDFLAIKVYQYYRLGNYKESIKHYRELLSLNDSYVLLSCYTLASAYRFTGELWYSYQYYEFLISFLNNDEVMLERNNKGLWFFLSNVEPIYFLDRNMKKCYALYGMALTSFLRYDYSAAE